MQKIFIKKKDKKILSLQQREIFFTGQQHN